ncbi:hypothetical protein A3K93_04715 [Acinetobacter sp. NCu2D-2]|uniref:protein kinase domain-containing protein n=1 Tax=Acinetobacter sp. NCu2D-2 TaxID=1608473 RepID=UPI0007CE0257|nr:serine/threonine-protein kinase [Acinetobacter sp. NCu2D-2]ANF81559.1 hypothetical protein A3K93_04715 [Acinetobacter sp. NCu2D-2]
MTQLCFNLNDLLEQKWTLKTKAKSLSYGRRLFQININGQSYWLKTQRDEQASDESFVKAFDRELAFYHYAEGNQLEICLPFQIFNQEFFYQGEQFIRGLLLPNALSIFSQSPKTFNLSQIKNIFIRAVEVLVDLSACGYIHADLKSDHFVIHQEKVCLIDFEQVQSMASKKTNMTATPRYMAPELFHGEAKSIASEIYALGIIFLEWLKQTRLTAKTYQDWAVLHCQNLDVHLSREYQCFEPLLRYMLVKRKEGRIQDLQSMRQWLMTEIE